MAQLGGGFWRVGHGREIELSSTAVIMAIVNVTPDSFSDGGRYDSVDKAVAHALDAVQAGAGIVDIGAEESTRPDAEASMRARSRRGCACDRGVARQDQALISIDTYRAETTRGRGGRAYRQRCLRAAEGA